MSVVYNREDIALCSIFRREYISFFSLAIILEPVKTQQLSLHKL